MHGDRNQSDVTERLWEVAEERAAQWVYLFGQQPEGVGPIAE
jgi:hypothetical protein